MPYPAVPDHRIAYDADGSLVYVGNNITGAAAAQSGPTLLEWQDNDFVNAGSDGAGGSEGRFFFFFPHQSEVTGIYARSAGTGVAISSVTGSNDTTDGMDGTWETASLPSGVPGYVDAFSWRSGIKPVSFTGPKKNVRVHVPGGGGGQVMSICHLYGEVAGGQMAHDLIFIDQDNGGGPIPYPSVEDFGGQPLGTTVVRQFRVKNTSASRTATNVNIQLNDADFAISTDNLNWVVTINIASLGPGVESATYYVRSTTPAPGAALGPRNPARIIVTCDSGFFG
jgi:hypothetical protein